MANNNPIFNAVIAGAGGANQERWIQSDDPAVYATYRTTVEAIATAVDAEIPAGSIGASQQALMQSICQGVFAGRYPQAESYSAIAQSIVALYTQLASGLQPDVTPGGTFDPIIRQLWIDTTKPDGGNGSIGTPFNGWGAAMALLENSGAAEPWLILINETQSVFGGPIPDIGSGGHDVATVVLRGVVAAAGFTSETVLSNVSTTQQSNGNLHLDFQDIVINGLELAGDTVYLTGQNARVATVSQLGTVGGTSNFVNCYVQDVALDNWDLRMFGGQLSSANQINNGVLDDVEFGDSCSLRWVGTLTLTNCRFRAGVSLLCASSQALSVDLTTWGAMRSAGVVFSDTTPTLTITPWMPVIANKAVVATTPINPGDSVVVVGAMAPITAEPSTGCITGLAIQVNSNLSVVGSFIDSSGDLNVIVRNTAASTQNLTNPTYTVTYLPRVTP